MKPTRPRLQPDARVRSGPYPLGNATAAALAIEPTSDVALELNASRTAPVPRPLLTAREVAGALRVSTATIYALVERSELAHVRIANSIRIAQAELERYLARD